VAEETGGAWGSQADHTALSSQPRSKQYSPGLSGEEPGGGRGEVEGEEKRQGKEMGRESHPRLL
jgi:hypothetical protein